MFELMMQRNYGENRLRNRLNAEIAQKYQPQPPVRSVNGLKVGKNWVQTDVPSLSLLRRQNPFEQKADVWPFPKQSALSKDLNQGLFFSVETAFVPKQQRLY